MNRAIVKLLSSSSRLIPRVYAGTSVASGAGHPPKADAHDHGHGHDQDHGHGHGHHHEPELRKTQAWRHHSGIQSKYENQSEDHSISFIQGKYPISIESTACCLSWLERPNLHDYRPAFGHHSIAVPYRTQAHLYEMWLYHAALIFSIWMWWYVSWRFIKEPSYFFGHAHYPDMSKFTDAELGIPADDLD